MEHPIFQISIALMSVFGIMSSSKIDAWLFLYVANLAFSMFNLGWNLEKRRVERFNEKMRGFL